MREDSNRTLEQSLGIYRPEDFRLPGDLQAADPSARPDRATARLSTSSPEKGLPPAVRCEIEGIQNF